MKRPAFQFYPGDWQHDSALRSCSVSARGLWIEMICLMHQADPYGHLVVNGKGLSPEVLARMVGCSQSECRKWLGELEGAGVFTYSEGVIVSRRMVRDEAVRRLRAEGGKLGGNPNLVGNHKTGKKVDRKVNHPPTIDPTPSSSSSSSETTSVPNGTDGSPSIPERKVSIWDVGEQLFRSRPYVSSLIKAHGEAAVTAAIAELSTLTVNDPKAWIKGKLNGISRGTSAARPQSAVDRNIATIAALTGRSPQVVDAIDGTVERLD